MTGVTKVTFAKEDVMKKIKAMIRLPGVTRGQLEGTTSLPSQGGPVVKAIMFGIIMAGVVTSGCAAKQEVIKDSNVAVSRAVNTGAVPQGDADLRISSSLKTHHPGAVSAKSDIHGTPEYKLIVKIDDRPVSLEVVQRPENNEGRGLRDAEVGQGVRYEFKAKARIKAGTHTVVVAIPADDIAVEREITVAEGSSNCLVIEPVYRWAPAKQRSPAHYGPASYQQGIKSLCMIFNNKALE